MTTKTAASVDQMRWSNIPGAGRQAIEGNPLTEDEMLMFEMFERDGWSAAQRRAHIIALVAPGTRRSDDDR